MNEISFKHKKDSENSLSRIVNQKGHLTKDITKNSRLFMLISIKKFKKYEFV